MCLVCQGWFRRAAELAWRPKAIPRDAIVITAVAMLIIPVAYFWLPRTNTAKETSSQERVTLPQPKLAVANPIAASQHGDDAEDTKRKQVHNILADQLFSLRRAYGKWTENDRNLMGSLLVKMQVDGAGNVVKVEDVTSRLTDTEFREVVLAEARKWKFPKANSDAAEYTVPLLFVPQGMDPRTIVRWERALNSSDVEAKAILPLHITGLSISEEKREPAVSPDQRAAEVKAPKMVDASARKTRISEDPPKLVMNYKTRRTAPLRQEPRFAAASAEDIDPGTPISVLEAKGDWLKVKTRPQGRVGYIRKEYVAPASGPQPFDAAQR